MTEPRLSLDGLTTGYGSRPVVQNVSCTINAGEFLSVMGGSGVGKTTLLRSICGVIEPLTGTVSINGTVVSESGRSIVPIEQREVGFMFQDFALFPHMSVLENVAYGIRDNSDRRTRALELLESVGLAQYADGSVRELSGGQKQRVALVRAIAPKPKILLLDEPFANLDPEAKKGLIRLVRQFVREHQVAAMMVTHNADDALQISDRLMMFEKLASGPAQCVQLDSPERVYAEPATRLVAQLTGDVIELDCHANGDSAECILGTVGLNQAHQGEVKAVIRPEQVTVSSNPHGAFRVVENYFCGPWSSVICVDESNQQIHLPRVSVSLSPNDKVSLSVVGKAFTNPG